MTYTSIKILKQRIGTACRSETRNERADTSGQYACRVSQIYTPRWKEVSRQRVLYEIPRRGSRRVSSQRKKNICTDLQDPEIQWLTH